MVVSSNTVLLPSQKHADFPHVHHCGPFPNAESDLGYADIFGVKLLNTSISEQQYEAKTQAVRPPAA
ncbi:unnamed protein product [Victoria cruziana]